MCATPSRRRTSCRAVPPCPSCPPPRPIRPRSPARPRRAPLTVWSAATVGILEALGLMATALTGIDKILGSPLRPEGWLVVVGLLVLAGWIVLCAGSGAALFDASGQRLFTAVAHAEIALVGMLVVVTTATSMPLPVALPLPVLAVLALAVPVVKLLLVARRRHPALDRRRAPRPRPPSRPGRRAPRSGHRHPRRHRPRADRGRAAGAGARRRRRPRLGVVGLRLLRLTRPSRVTGWTALRTVSA